MPKRTGFISASNRLTIQISADAADYLLRIKAVARLFARSLTRDAALNARVCIGRCYDFLSEPPRTVAR
jgi:hypothetical protein